MLYNVSIYRLRLQTVVPRHSNYQVPVAVVALSRRLDSTESQHLHKSNGLWLRGVRRFRNIVVRQRLVRRPTVAAVAVLQLSTHLLSGVTSLPVAI